MEIVNNDDVPEVQIPVHGGGAQATEVPPTAPITPGGNTSPPEFYTQHIKTMKNLEAPQQPSKIVVKSRDHKESVNLAKLHNGMLQLMYAISKINWTMALSKIFALQLSLMVFVIYWACQLQSR